MSMYEMKILILYWPSRISVKAMCNVRTTKKAEITSKPGPFAWVSKNDCYFHQKNKHACNTSLFQRHLKKKKHLNLKHLNNISTSDPQNNISRTGFGLLGTLWASEQTPLLQANNGPEIALMNGTVCSAKIMITVQRGLHAEHAVMHYLQNPQSGMN